jgi:hypothetical protein
MGLNFPIVVTTLAIVGIPMCPIMTTAQKEICELGHR